MTRFNRCKRAAYGILAGLVLATGTENAEPRLEAQLQPGEVHLTWAEVLESWVLESCPNPADAAGWSLFPIEPDSMAGMKTVVVPSPVAPLFWRLRPGGTTLVVTVKDTPAPGNPLEYSEVPPAFDYLNTHLAEGQMGEVVLATDRRLEVARLEFHRPINLRIAEGFSPTLAGPADGSPLVVEAVAACGLAGLSVEGAGGLSISAQSHLDFRGNQAAKFDLHLGGGGATMRTHSAHRDGSSGPNVYNVANNVSVGPLNLTMGSNLNATLDANGNQAPTLNVAMQGYLNGGLNLVANLVDSLNAQLTIGSQTSARIKQHVDLDKLSIEALMENGTLEVESNVGAEAALAMEGVGTLGLRLKKLQFDKMTLGLAAGGDWTVYSDDDEYDNFTIDAAADVEVNATGFTAKSYARFDSEAGVKAALNFYGKAAFDGGFEIGAKGELEFLFEDVSAKAFAQVVGEGDVYRAVIQRGRFDAGLSVETPRVGVSFYMTVGGGGPVSFGDVFDVNVPDLPARTLIFKDGDCGVGVSVNVLHDLLGGGRSAKSSTLAPDRESGDQVRSAGGGKFEFTNLRFAGPPSGAPAIGINGMSEPITIEKCNFKGSMSAVNVGDCTGSITIRDNEFQDGGISLADCPGNITITEARLNLNQPPGALVVGDTGTITLTDSELNASGGAFAIMAVADTEIDASGNTIDGIILIGGGEEHPARIAFSNTTFSGSSIIQDATGRSGGLRKDPMDEGNSGMNPSFIFSLIDFDGNGCADYPPERNLKKPPDYTECEVEGIPPP